MRASRARVVENGKNRTISSQARITAATTPSSLIQSGSPEEAYQAVMQAKMLWSFRRRDIGSWREVIDQWATEPKAWNRIPEMKPYGTAKAMIEAEVCDSHEAFLSFIAAVVGRDYAAKLDGSYADRPGPTIRLSDPAAVGKYLGERVDSEWIDKMLAAYQEQRDVRGICST